MKLMHCTHCGSLDSAYSSWYTDKSGRKYRNYKCGSCGRHFCEKPRKYTFEQKQEAIDGYLAIGRNHEAAKAFGCSVAQIVKWRWEFAKYGLISAEHAPRRRAKEAPMAIAAE
jgi:transposase-like protein